MTTDNPEDIKDLHAQEGSSVAIVKKKKNKSKKKKLLLLSVIVIFVAILISGSVYIYLWTQVSTKAETQKQLKSVTQADIESKSQSELESLAGNNGSSAKDRKARALALYQLDKTQEAVEAFKQLEQNYELDAQTYIDYGLIAVAAGQKDLGLQKLEKALAMLKASGGDQTQIDRLATKIERIRKFG